jgi:preprotein translocase subunit SecG
MQTVLIVIHLLVAVALIGVVLLQRSEGGALGIGGGGSGGAGFGGLFSPRGAASTLTRTTAILAFLFLLTSLSLTYFSLGARQDNSLFGATPGGGVPTLPSSAPTALPEGGPPALPGAVDVAPAEPAAPAPAGPPTLPNAAPETPAE